MGFDSTTHQLFLPTADFEPQTPSLLHVISMTFPSAMTWAIG